jgi:hypothetical protein
MLPIRHKEKPISETWLPFSPILPLKLLGFNLFLKYAVFETTISTNSHTRLIKLPEDDKVIMVLDCVKKKRLLP